MDRSDEKKPTAAPETAGPEELLHRIMGELEMEPDPPAKRRGYHARLLLRCALPRVLAALAAVLAVALLVLAAARPVEPRQLTVEPQENGSVLVSFQLDRSVFVRQVQARLNGKPVFVVRDDASCAVLLSENGRLELETVTLLGGRGGAELAVDAVDDQPPQLNGDTLAGGVLTIGLTDGEGCGIDWEKIRAYGAESREEYPLLERDEGGSCIRLTLPDFGLYIEIPDKAGNRLALRLEPDR